MVTCQLDSPKGTYNSTLVPDVKYKGILNAQWYLYVCMYVCMYVCIYVCICICVCLNVCINVCINVCMDACMYV